MKIVGEALKPGSEFEYCARPDCQAAASFVAIGKDETIVTRRAADLFRLPDDTPVIANWHGERMTDAYLLTVAELKVKAHVAAV
jgi:hypothetical protein